MIAEYKQRLQMQGFSWEDAIKSDSEENIMKTIREDAIARIKNSLVIDKIAQVENIKVESADLEKKFKELEMAYQMPKAELMKQLQQNPSLFTSISQQALNERVIAFLSENNKVEFKKPKAKKAKAE